MTSCTSASKLDAGKLQKVLALAEQSSFPEERKAALAKAEAIASAAGLTLDAARASLGMTDAPKPTSFFDALSKNPVIAEMMREQEEKRARERLAVMELYGTEEAVFAPTAREIALEDATAGLREWESFTCSETGEQIEYVSKLDGWDGFTTSTLPPALREAAGKRVPLPSTLRKAMDEYRYWDKLAHHRELIDRDSSHSLAVQARMLLLQELLDQRPAESWEDYRARLEWWRTKIEWGFHLPYEEKVAMNERLLADLEALTSNLDASAGATRSRPMRRQEKADAIDQLLRTQPELSSREIARRLGLSPQTVATRRRKLLAEGEQG